VSAQTLWYVARAGGLIAWGLLAASVLWGLALSTRALGKRPRPAWLLDLHRYLGGLGVIFVAVHVTAIMLDSYVPFGPVATFVPFASSWHPVAVAWGIVALYLLLAVELTSLARAHLPRRLWRQVHYLSFAVFVLATVHGISAGTDRNTAAMLLTFVVVTGLLAVLAALRFTPARPNAAPPVRRPPTRRPAPAARPVRAPHPSGAGAPTPPPRVRALS